MRGFWADEKIDGGHWRTGSRLYRLTKRFERRFFESADAIVSLTHAGVAAFPSLGYGIADSVPVEVIPTCTDLARFTPGRKDPALAASLGLAGSRVIGVSGTTTNWYLRKPMLECLALLVREIDNAKVLMVTRDDRAGLEADAIAAGIPADRLVITTAPYDRMPDVMRLMDIGLFFIKVCFSKKGSCATKLAEFLATGVPVIINDGVGDSGTIVAEARAGIVLPEATVDALRAALPAVRALLTDREAAARCRAAACRHFDVEAGTRAYRQLYERVLRPRAAAGGALKARAI
jgi:glycosyltransferase involved in cell wall biosynthesis